MPAAFIWAMSSSTWSSASGPPTSGLSPPAILPGVATQFVQSVFESPFSTWKPAVDDPHMKPCGNVTSAGGGGGEPPPDDEELQASTTGSATPSPPCHPLVRRPSMPGASYHLGPLRCSALPLE